MRRFVSYALMLKHLKQVVLLRLRRFLNDDGGAIRQLLTLLQPPAQTKNSFGKFVAFGKIPRVKPRNVDRRADCLVCALTDVRSFRYAGSSVAGWISTVTSYLIKMSWISRMRSTECNGCSGCAEGRRLRPKPCLNASVLFAVSWLGSFGFLAHTASAEEAKPRTTFRLPTGDPGAEERHPLLPIIQQAEVAYRDVQQNVRDYSCIMVRRERVNGRLGNHEFIYAKVRNRRVRNGELEVPFSVYMRFLKPKKVAGREVLFVEGQNDGEMFVRNGGIRFAFVTTRLDPNSDLAMSENRYPITEFGIDNLLLRLVQRARDQRKYDCDVQYLEDVKINGRPATGIVIKNHMADSDSDFYEARVFVDNELNLPIHYEAYAPPVKEGQPRLLEQYTYTKLRLNVGYTDADFDPDNPDYRVK